MKPLAILFLLAAPGLQFEITDGRGKLTSSVTIEAGAPDADGWRPLSVVNKGKGEPVLIWPMDATAKEPDGQGPIPAIVIQRGEEKALASRRVAAAIAVPVVLGTSTIDEMARKTGFRADSLAKAFSTLGPSNSAFESGVGLLYAARFPDAAEKLAVGLKERQRQLTRFPSEIYPAALLYGLALTRENKFDDAAVAFLIALRQRPSSELARRLRADALVHSGKPEAAEPDTR